MHTLASLTQFPCRENGVSADSNSLGAVVYNRKSVEISTTILEVERAFDAIKLTSGSSFRNNQGGRISKPAKRNRQLSGARRPSSSDVSSEPYLIYTTPTKLDAPGTIGSAGIASAFKQHGVENRISARGKSELGSIGKLNHPNALLSVNSILI
jgi:hypothetical protein